MNSKGLGLAFARWGMLLGLIWCRIRSRVDRRVGLGLVVGSLFGGVLDFQCPVNLAHSKLLRRAPASRKYRKSTTKNQVCVTLGS